MIVQGDGPAQLRLRGRRSSVREGKEQVEISHPGRDSDDDQSVTQSSERQLHSARCRLAVSVQICKADAARPHSRATASRWAAVFSWIAPIGRQIVLLTSLCNALVLPL